MWGTLKIPGGQGHQKQNPYANGAHTSTHPAAVALFAQQLMHKDRGVEMYGEPKNIYLFIYFADVVFGPPQKRCLCDLLIQMQAELLEAGPGPAACADEAALLPLPAGLHSRLLLPASQHSFDDQHGHIRQSFELPACRYITAAYVTPP